MRRYLDFAPAALPLAFSLLTAEASCAQGGASSPTPPPQSTSVRTGTWGGNHIGLEVTDSGARVEYDCAHGSIDQRLEVDREGRFDARGGYVRERGGPQPVEEESPQPARYAGRVDGDAMTLTVSLTQSNQTIGTFTLTFGNQPLVRKCQ